MLTVGVGTRAFDFYGNLAPLDMVEGSDARDKGIMLAGIEPRAWVIVIPLSRILGNNSSTS
jgi:hypothetical protein